MSSCHEHQPHPAGSCEFPEAAASVGGSSWTMQSSRSKSSNNQGGRPTKADMVRANGLSAAKSVLSFDCPRLCRRSCESLYMGGDEQVAAPAQAAAIVASVHARSPGTFEPQFEGQPIKARFGT